MGRKYLALCLVVVMLLSMFSITSIADTGSTWTTNFSGTSQNNNVDYTDLNSVYFKTNGLSYTPMYVRVVSNGNTVVLRTDGVPETLLDHSSTATENNYHLVDFLNPIDFPNIRGGVPYHVEIADNLQFTNAKSDMFKIVEDSSLLLTKAVAETSVGLGETVHYTLTITNNGNMDLTGIIVHDPMMGADKTISLVAGASTIITYEYGIKAGDLPAVETTRNLDNTAMATVGSLTVSDTKSVAVTNPAVPGLTLDKSAVETEVTYPGTIHYKLVVKNTGNVTLTNILVTDTMWDAADTISSLAAGESKVYNYTYTVKSIDLPDPGKTGSIVNASTASEKTYGLSDEDSVAVGVSNEAKSSINVTKSANKADGYVGDIVTYTVVVKNTGNVQLDNVTLTDSLKAPVQSIGTLLPNEEKTWVYDLALASDTSGMNVNTVTAAGFYLPVEGQPVPVMDTAMESVKLNTLANVEIQKWVIPVGHQNFSYETSSLMIVPVISLGGYEFTLTGTGYLQTRTTDGTGNAAFSGLRDGTYVLTETPVAGYTNSLPPAGLTLHVDKDGGVWTGEGDEKSYLDGALSVWNYETENPLLTIDKQVSDAAPLVGSNITYTIVLKNEGNLTMSGIVLEDSRKGPLTLPVTLLAPGESTSVSYSETITSAAQIVNVATAAGFYYSEVKYGPISDSVTVNPRTPIQTPIPVTPVTTTVTPVTTTVTPVTTTVTTSVTTPEQTPVLTPVPTLAPAPEVVLTPEPLPEAVPVVIVDTPNEVSQAAPTLPKTGGLPLMSLIFMGSGLVGGGLFIRKRK